MQLSALPAYLLVFISLVMLTLRCEAREEKEGKTIRHLCGNDFKRIWDLCCDHQCGPEAYKRTLGLTMSAEKASGFLESAWKRNHLLSRRTGGGVDAVEECCYEGCSIEEVSEYFC